MAFETSSVRGVNNHYGPRKTDQTFGGSTSTKGYTKEVVYVVDLAEVISGAPATSQEIISSSTSNLQQVIPAYSKVLQARWEVLEAIATTGGSAATSASLSVGLEQADGTAIDIDGLIDATDGALTIASNDIAEPRGSYTIGGSAALVPDYGTAATPGETVSIGSANGELTATLTIDDITGMTAIAGKVRIVVQYIPEGPGGA